MSSTEHDGGDALDLLLRESGLSPIELLRLVVSAGLAPTPTLRTLILLAMPADPKDATT